MKVTEEDRQRNEKRVQRGADVASQIIIIGIALGVAMIFFMLGLRFALWVFQL